MSKADKMFEELGYKVENTKSNIFIGKDEENFSTSFIIHKKNKEITFYEKRISIDVFQAINEKCKELRFLW